MRRLCLVARADQVPAREVVIRGAQPVGGQPRRRERVHRRERADRRPRRGQPAPAPAPRGGRPGRQRADRQEDRPLDGDVVPVDVDEGVQKADGERQRERDGRATPDRHDGGGDHRSEEEEADDAELAQELQRRRMRLDDGERALMHKTVGQLE